MFNEIFSFQLDHSRIADTKLRVAVWDHDFFGEDDFNGEGVVDLSAISLNSETQTWARAYCQYTIIAFEVNMITQYLQQILGYHVEFKVCLVSKPPSR